MKISELIQQLQIQMEELGDKEVTVCDVRDEYFTIEKEDIQQSRFGLLIDMSDKNL